MSKTNCRLTSPYSIHGSSTTFSLDTASVQTKLTSPIDYREMKAELKCGLKAKLYGYSAWGSSPERRLPRIGW